MRVAVVSVREVPMAVGQRLVGVEVHVPDTRQDLEPGLVSQQHGQSAADERFIIGQQHPDHRSSPSLGSIATTSYPPPSSRKVPA